MKILKLIALSFLFISLNSMGQNNKFLVGIAGGPSLTNLRGNDFIKENQSASIRYVGSFSVEYKFNSLLSIASNLSYEGKGTKQNFTFTDNLGNIIGNGKLLYNFNYITIPVLARLSIGKNKSHFFFNTGPYLGFLLQQKSIFTYPNNQKQTYTDTPSYKKLDLGLSAGVGFLAPLGKKLNVSFETRYNFGFSEISKLPIYGSGSIKTNSFNALLGLTYNFGKTE